MTNKEYLDALANDDPRRLAAWFASTHVEADFVGRRASVVAGEVLMFAQMSGIELCTERGCKTVITNTIKETCGIAMHNGMFVQKDRESYDE